MISKDISLNCKFISHASANKFENGKENRRTKKEKNTWCAFQPWANSINKTKQIK